MTATVSPPKTPAWMTTLEIGTEGDSTTASESLDVSRFGVVFKAFSLDPL
jgi:hypothetical protein